MLQSLHERDRAALDAHWARLLEVFDIVDTVGDAVAVIDAGGARAGQSSPPAAGNSIPTYLISSWFLADCQRQLIDTAKGHERLHFVTGMRTDNVRTLDRMVPVALETSSAIHAAADQLAANRILIEMDEWGHSVHGLFHSHPGAGPRATHPSSTDYATHERYEQGGYPLVGAIFVKDGYVRFFSKASDFTIKIYGQGVEQVDENIFKIAGDNLQIATPQADHGGGSERDRSARAPVRIQPSEPI
jgi:proteasome lid subunit RPN8/RPN11